MTNEMTGFLPNSSVVKMGPGAGLTEVLAKPKPRCQSLTVGSAGAA